MQIVATSREWDLRTSTLPSRLPTLCNWTSIEPNRHWENYNKSLLAQPPVALNAARRDSITRAVHETCEKRRWLLYAFNIRTNHGHVVVHSADRPPGIILNALKANATRQMLEDGCWASERSPWVERGSKRWLWNERSLERAIHYVLFGQGDELPDFD